MFQAAANAQYYNRTDRSQQGPPHSARMTIEFGYRLIPMFDARLGGRALAGITKAGQRAANELGIRRSIIELRQNLALLENHCRFFVNGTPTFGAVVDQGRMRATRLQHACFGHNGPELGSRLCNLDSRWVTQEQVPGRIADGYRILSPQQWLSTLVETTLWNFGHLLLSYRDIERRLARKRDHKLVPFRRNRHQPRDIARLGLVFRRLARWRMPLDDIAYVRDSLATCATPNIDDGAVAEHARRALFQQLILDTKDSSGLIHVIDMDSATRTILTDVAIEYPYSCASSSLELHHFVRQLLIDALGRLAETGNRSPLLIPLELKKWFIAMFGYTIEGIPVITREDLPEGYRVAGSAVLSIA